MKGRCLAPLALMLLSFSDIAAVEPVTRLHGRYDDFADGTGQGVAISSEGRLTLAPAWVLLVDVESQRIWDLAIVGNVLWLGTGDEGQLFRLQRDGKAQLLLDSPEIGIQTLVGAGAGGVFAGTSPDGIIYRIDDNGGVKTVAHTTSRYVWDLVTHKDGLLAATGGPAQVIHIKDGQSHLWFESADDGHVRALVQAGDHWFAGTAVASGSSEGEGAALARIYEIGSDTQRLVLETEFEEVTFLVASGDTIFAAVTTTPSAGDGGSATPHSALLRIEPGGAAFSIWEGKGIFAGLLAPTDGKLTAVLREPGRVLQLQTDGTNFERVTRIDSIVANTAIRWNGRLLVGDGSSRRVAKLSSTRRDSGWFDAPVEDLGAHGQWGTLQWHAHTPRGTSVQLRTRSGNSAVPDENWSSWSAALSESGSRISSPPARYLQYRVVLHGNIDDPKDGPFVQRVSFTARQTNLPPRIKSLATFAYRGNPQAPGPLPPQPVNGGGNGSFRLPQSKSLRVVRWHTSDLNGDQLSYRLYLRGEDQHQWKLVEENLELTSVFWDTESMPEGMTQLRLVASDAVDNPTEWALEAERISKPFPIDNSPPVVQLKTRQQDGVWFVEASLTDQVTAIHGASYSVDYADHGPRLAAQDGLFDSRMENAFFDLGDLPKGEHIISVQAWDQLDNVGVARVVVGVD